MAIEKNKNKKHVIVIGLDGARYDVVSRWVNQGKLPTFRKIIDNGVSGPLLTVLPGPHSASAWTSFCTGMNPGKHGLPYSIIPNFKEKKMDFLTGKSIKVKKIWDYLCDEEKIVGVFDIPMTYPVEKVNGVMVSSWGTPALESEYTYPKEIRKNMDKFGGSQPPDCETKTDAALKRLYDATNKRFNAIRWFFDEYQWDFFIINLIGTELLHHLYMGFLEKGHPFYKEDYEEIVLRYYEKIDAFLKELVEKYPDANIIVASDHGTGPTKNYVYVNNVLQKLGYFQTMQKNDASKKALYSSIKDKTAKTYFLLPEKIRNIISTLTPKSIASSLKQSIVLNMDWDKTTAFTQGMGMIYINKDCRQAKYDLNKYKDYLKLRKEIIGRLMSAKEIQGTIEKIYVKEDLFRGDYLDKMPDIIPIFKQEFKPAIKTPLDKYIEPINSEMIARHTMEGLFLGYGPDIASNKKVNDLSILDVTPTILGIFGINPYVNFDGKRRYDILNKNIKRLSKTQAKKSAMKNNAPEIERLKIKNSLSDINISI